MLSKFFIFMKNVGCKTALYQSILYEFEYNKIEFIKFIHLFFILESFFFYDNLF